MTLRPGGSPWRRPLKTHFGGALILEERGPLSARTGLAHRVAEMELSDTVAEKCEDLGVEYKAWMDTRPHEARANLARHIAAPANHGGD